MRIQKIFNPALLGKVLLSPYFQRWKFSEPRYWESKAEARKYAQSLAMGLTIWSTIDIIAVVTFVFISFFVSIPPIVTLCFIAFAVGCPLIMTLGVGFGCMHHLTLQETWIEVRDYFREE